MILKEKEFNELKTVCKNARANNEETFEFMGDIYLVDYAEYLIEYIENDMKKGD